MSTITSPELTEVTGKLNEKRKQLHDIFDEAGPDRDMAKVKSLEGDSQAKVEAIRAINSEIDELAKKEADILTVLKAAGHAFDYVGNDGASAEGGDIADRFKGARKSLGERFNETKRESLKQFRHNFEDVDIKAYLKATMTTAAGWAPDVVRGPRVVDYVVARLTLLDFIPMVGTNQTSVSYMEETTRTNAAAERDEGAAKAESTLVLTERTSAVRSIATSMGVTDEQLEDVERIDNYLNTRLPQFLRERLEGQILVGDGVAPNLRGILNTVGIQTQAKGADPTPDAIYKAMVKIMTTGGASPDAVVMNPLDWQDVRLLRTADGIYIWGSPADAGPERIWGLPVILNERETQNTAIVGAFRQYSEIDVKKGITVERGFINDDFTKDITRLRAEMRAAFVVYRPTAFCSVTGV
jgi:HK97 family phage major capsid protein